MNNAVVAHSRRNSSSVSSRSPASSSWVGSSHVAHKRINSGSSRCSERQFFQQQVNVLIDAHAVQVVSVTLQSHQQTSKRNVRGQPRRHVSSRFVTFYTVNLQEQQFVYSSINRPTNVLATVHETQTLPYITYSNWSALEGVFSHKGL